MVRAKTRRLGGKFVDRVEQGIEKIERNPLGFEKLAGENRRCVLQKFPYCLWFKARDEVVIVACLHAKRSPVFAKERAAGVREMPKPK